MSDYKITEYSYIQAIKLNLVIKTSKNKAKKIDVYSSSGNFIHSIGDIRYNDYANYCTIFNETYANKRRRLYHIRHKKGINIINSKQYLSANLL